MDTTLQQTNHHRKTLYEKYRDKLVTNPDLNRSLVSFQANKKQAFFRWFKYKEAFSSEFIRYIINKFPPGKESSGRILDPFAGVGTTLTTSSMEGWESTGIELLPVSVNVIRSQLLSDQIVPGKFSNYIAKLKKIDFENAEKNGFAFPHITITKKAFSDKTEKDIGVFESFLKEIEDENIKNLFRFACLSILEQISFTRKDGQYLRWDFRSGRSLRSKFNKGKIYDLRTSVISRLNDIYNDIKRDRSARFNGNVRILEGSCLQKLPELPDSYFDLVITSPPYCNRYDYTRTYALELAYLGCGEDDVKKLRQTLLSATVENKSKREQLERDYINRGRTDFYKKAESAFEEQKALHEVLDLLNIARKKGELNNSNIPNMVENYFYEINIVINELSRVLAPGGHIVMVNDNVRYHGEEVPVDLILSDFAEKAGLSVECIWVLPKGKGNSSQQMGNFGRKEIRKCVYVWKKTF